MTFDTTDTTFDTIFNIRKKLKQGPGGSMS
jgi:hypothetical protein